MDAYTTHYESPPRDGPPNPAHLADVFGFFAGVLGLLLVDVRWTRHVTAGAADELEENQRLVWWALHRYRYPLGDRDWHTAESAAWEGLLSAARFYDESSGTTFATFAATCIRRKLSSTAFRSRRFAKRFQQWDDEHADETQPDDGDHDEHRIDAIEEVRHLLATVELSERELEALRLRFWDGAMYRDIGRRLGGVSVSRSRDIVARAIAKLRRAARR